MFDIDVQSVLFHNNTRTYTHEKNAFVNFLLCKFIWCFMCSKEYRIESFFPNQNEVSNLLNNTLLFILMKFIKQKKLAFICSQ